jgi:hypothetical protein
MPLRSTPCRQEAVSALAVRLLARAAFSLGLVLASDAWANIYTVTNSADSGLGSLRQAIVDANAQQVTGSTRCAPHSIVFAIPGTGLHTIQPLSPLPVFNIPITLDGYTQAGSSLNTLAEGSNAVITIELDGSLAGAADAIVIGASIPASPLCSGNTSVISGLVINRFAGAAVSMGEESCPGNGFCPVGGVRIQGNFFGTDASGMLARANGVAPVAPIWCSRHEQHRRRRDRSWALNPAHRGPPISVAGGDGIHRIDTRRCAAESHRIPTTSSASASGTTALPNAGRGITVDLNSTNIAIHDNLISANLGDGVAIFDSPTAETTVIGNGIGIGVGGLPIGNGGNGVLVAGNTTGAFVGVRYRFAAFGTASISHNAGAGLFVGDLAQVDVNASIGGNGGTAIDLAPIGVTPNDNGDSDSGPNELLNKPDLHSVIFDPSLSSTTITGTLNAAPNSSYEIHFYVSSSCDASGFGGNHSSRSIRRRASSTRDDDTSGQCQLHAAVDRSSVQAGPHRAAAARSDARSLGLVVSGSRTAARWFRP